MDNVFLKSLLKDSLLSGEMKGRIARILQEEISRISEATDLVSLVAKATTEEKANAAVGYLKQHDVDARSRFPSKFNPYDQTEKDAWGILVRPNDVKSSAKILKPVSKELTFDPFVRTGTK